MGLALFEIDKTIMDKCPVEPTLLDILSDLSADAKAEREKQNSKLMSCYEIDKINWERSNHKCLMVIKERILEGIRGQSRTVRLLSSTFEYLEKVESQFTGSSKAYASSLIKRLISEKYIGGGVRDHILRMSNVAARLKPLDLAIKDGFLIFNSLLMEFKTFEVNYNSMNDKWTLKKFIAMCVQEEERIKRNNGGVDSVNMAKHHQKRKNFPPRRKIKEKL
jgi:molybdopterin converting factor small subunit